MRVFDFDNTLYQGESTFDFAMFIVKKKKSLLRYVPQFIRILFLYKVCKLDINEFTDKLEKYSKQFLENKEWIMESVDEFWDENIGKLYPHMLKKIKKSDVILTTSPDFLLKGIDDVLNTDHIFGTTLDFAKGKISHLNFQENKVKKFLEAYPNKEIDEFYTDSYNDEPLMKISKKVFLVKNGVIKQIK